MAVRLSWKTEKRRITDLVPAPYNPRQLTEKQAKDLRKSLEKFDLAEIPAVDTDGTIIAGHQRLAMLREMGRGEEEIDVRVPSRKLTEREQREYNLRSNKNTGEFDWDKLAEFDKDLLVDVGFDTKELDRMFQVDTSEDDVPEVRSDPETKTGDLWRLGEHYLLCGDAAKRDDVERLMGGEKAEMCFTDPPYGVNYGAKNRMLNSFQPAGRNLNDIAGDTGGVEELKTLVSAAFRNIRNALSPGSAYYVCSLQGGELGLMMMMMMEAGIECRHMIVWAKDIAVFSMGRLDYSYRHEPILYGWTEGAAHRFYGGNTETTVWEIPRPRRSKEHSTMKPLELVMRAVKNSSQRGEIVLDLFGGSGTTLIACERLGRRCFMAEVEPQYVAVILDKYTRETGKDAVRLSDGKTWSEVSISKSDV